MVPQVLQLNEMQPCWEERLPHCPRYPPIIHTRTYVHTPTHKPELFSCYPHAVPAPTLLMFIHQPLKGQMQRPVKTKSGLFLNDATPSPLSLRQPDLRGFPNSAFKEGPRDGRWPHVHSRGQSEMGKTFGGHERGRHGQRTRPHFHWWPTACHPGSIMISDWQVEGRRGWEQKELRMRAAQNVLPYRGPWRCSLMIKNIPGKACFLCMPAMLFVGWD